MVWRWLHSIEWAHLPYAGGLLDQPEELMSDIMLIQWQYSLIKGHTKANIEAQKFTGGVTHGSPRS